MKNLKGIIITTIVSLLITFLYLIAYKVFQVIEDVKTNNSHICELYKLLSNGFILSGGLVAGYGLLIFVSNEGAFDMLAYGFIKFFDMFKKDLTKAKHRTFYDYRMAKKDTKRSFAFILIIGIINIGLSFLFLCLYEKSIVDLNSITNICFKKILF